MATIRRADVETFVAGMRDLAPNTVKTYVSRVSGVFTMAVSALYIPRNPCVGVRLPRRGSGKVQPLTVDEVHRLFDAAPDWFRVAVVLGARLGIRQSEIRGLTIDRVRFLHREVRIDRQLARSELVWGPTKNSEVRTIPTDAVVLEAISAHLARFGEGEQGLILHRGGRFVSAWTMGDARRSLRLHAGLPDARYHDLRHHLASELLGDGMSLPAVAGILGDTPGTVLAAYGHFVLADNDRPRATMRRLWTRTDEDLDATEDQLRTGSREYAPDQGRCCYRTGCRGYGGSPWPAASRSRFRVAGTAGTRGSGSAPWTSARPCSSSCCASPACSSGR